MKLEGHIWQDKDTWLVEVEALDLVSQGETQKDALEMIADAVEALVNADAFRATATLLSESRFVLGANSTKLLTALLLRRQREAAGLSLSAVADRLGQTSKNAYGRYEQGQSEPSLEKLEELLQAVAPRFELLLSAQRQTKR